jgi:hypothetical protein
VMKRSAYFTSDAAVTREAAIVFGMDPAHEHRTRCELDN